ncbi:MAG: hypothetical protein ABIJ56_24185 [Pseudomonadota bacterium]
MAATLLMLSCSTSPGGGDAYIWFSWTIDGYPGGASACSVANASTVVIEDDLDGDGIRDFRESFYCSRGVAKTSWHYTSYETVFIRFILYSDDDEMISESPWDPFVPEPGENLFTVDFETSPDTQGDAAIDLEWTIDGGPATSAACDEVAGSTVRIEHDEDGDLVSDFDFDFPCSAGEGRTDYHFYSGYHENIRFALLEGESVLSATEWDAVLIEEGVNFYSVNFNTGTPPPPDRAALAFGWYIHFVPGDEDICAWADAGTVMLMIDDDGDGEEDITFNFDCEDGSGVTDDIFDPDREIHFAFALADSSGEIISMTAEYNSITPDEGENRLGDVNFLIGDYGPLAVELRWADAISSEPNYADCDSPMHAVSAIGYLLRDEDGDIYDLVDIDDGPVSCAGAVTWDVIAFGTYELVVDGKDVTGDIVWGSMCSDLVVDSWDRDSNEHICNIDMTRGP